MPHLIILDASHNHLTDFFGFQPPKNLKVIQFSTEHCDVMWGSVFPCIAEWRITSCLIDDSQTCFTFFIYQKQTKKKLFLEGSKFSFCHFSFFFAGGEFFTQPDCSNEGSFCIFFFVQTDSWLYPFECCKAWHNVRNSFYFSNVFPSKKTLFKVKII